MDVTTAIIDRAGANVAFVLPGGLTLVRRLNSYADVSMSIGERDDPEKVAAIIPAQAGVSIWRDGELRFRGQITALSGSLDEDGSALSVKAADPLWWLQSRFTRAPLTYAAQDAGSGIAWPVIALQNGYEPTHLGQGTIAASVNRDRTYEVGKRVSEIVQQLAEVENGFWFVARPVESGETFSLLDIMYPTSGATLSSAPMEYGPNTIGNIAGVPTIEETRPWNRVTVIGGPNTVPAIAENTASIAAYGLIEEWQSAPDVIRQTTLQEHANALLHSGVKRTFTFKLAPSSSASVPVAGVDFDIGDIVPIRINDGWKWDISASMRVTQTTTVWSDDANTEQTDVIGEEV